MLPHHSVRASFRMGRWPARFCQPIRYSVIWPAALVSAKDKTRSSKSAEVRRIWEVYDECLQVVHPGFWEEIRTALLAGDVSLAWNAWFFSKEVSLFRSFIAAGGPMPTSGLRLGRGSAKFRMVALGGLVVVKLRSDISGSEDGQSVHLYKDASVSGIIMQRRKLRCVLTVLDGIARHGPSRTRSLELAVQWNAVSSAGPCGPLC